MKSAPGHPNQSRPVVWRGTLTIPCPTGNVSDGYHTFDELYEHRHALFIALMKEHKQISWFSKKHADGTMFEGWFVAGMALPTGQITYHLPNMAWHRCVGAGLRELDKAPEFDGHTPADVVTRIQEWILI